MSDDPGSVDAWARRIRAYDGEAEYHEHEFMFWLADATAVLDIPDAEEALMAALGLPLDEACAQIVREHLSPPQRARSAPS